MKFVIEFEDIWTDENGALDKAIKQHIIHSAKQEVLSIIDEKVKSEYNKQIKAAIEKQMQNHIKALIRKLVRDETIVIKHYNDEEPMSVRDYVVSRIKNTRGYNTITDSVMSYAEKFVEEMKQRYDMAFASQIVSKMAEKKLLKDENIEKLLEK
jgi:thioesterase domain-containing protein